MLNSLIERPAATMMATTWLDAIDGEGTKCPLFRIGTDEEKDRELQGLERIFGPLPGKRSASFHVNSRKRLPARGRRPETGRWTFPLLQKHLIAGESGCRN